KFIDEWLNYANQERLFSVSFIQNSSFIRYLLRYWHTMLPVAPNLSEFACQHHNQLLPSQAAKIVQVS
ncbi:10669_t:CDS:2, partial [Scutellospora calospora]